MNNPIVDVALSLGSNVRRYQNINAGLSALEAEFESVTCSPVYESAAVGFAAIRCNCSRSRVL
ncbi:MAG: hypothetical protein P8X74_09535, partial [Reinekea sp.]